MGTRVAVTGATGLVGGNLARELVAGGYAVRGTRRATSQVDHLSDQLIEWVEADLADGAALTRAFDCCDAVFHCAALVTVDRKPTSALVAANVEGTKNVLQAVREARVDRLVHCSTASTIGVSEDGAPCDETTEWNFDRHGLDDGYVVTKTHAERLVLDSDADVVVVNPTFMLGPFDPKPSSGQLVLGAARGWPPFTSEGRNNFVDVRSVARGMVLACQRGRRGERYILGDRNMRYREIQTRIAEIAGRKPRLLSVGPPLASMVGLAGDVWQRMTKSTRGVNTSVVRWSQCEGYIMSSDKAKEELGYVPGDLDAAIADAIAWFIEVGMLEERR